MNSALGRVVVGSAALRHLVLGHLDVAIVGSVLNGAIPAVIG